MDKLEVIEKHDSLVVANGVALLSENSLQSADFCQDLVKRILNELQIHGTLLDPKEKRKMVYLSVVYLPGSSHFDAMMAEAVLLALHAAKDPMHKLRDKKSIATKRNSGFKIANGLKISFIIKLPFGLCQKYPETRENQKLMLWTMCLSRGLLLTYM